MLLQAEGMNELLNYRTYLRDTLNDKIQSNPKYSLRAFARDLKVSPSVLSELINGKHSLSEKVAIRIATQLELSPSEKQLFCDQVISQSSQSKQKRAQASARVKSIQEMFQKNSVQVDTFKIISDWYHFAILELTYLKNFKSDAEWISKKLGITKLEASAAIERLLRLELLELKNKKLIATEDYTMTSDGIPSEALRKFQKQLIEKALTALATQSINNRDITSLIVSVDKSRLPEAKKDIKEFRQRFNNKFGLDENRDSVYCLALQLFELTEKV